jgi:phosphate transport system substrate-binding protein
VLRPADESDNLLLEQFFPGMANSLTHLRTRGDLSVAATDQDNAEMAEKLEGALIATTLTQMTCEKRGLRFVALDGVMPSLEAYENGSYPYGNPLYFVAPAKISAGAQAFLSVIAEPEGEALLRRAGIRAKDR